jgi:hypothetical protein
VVELTLYIEWMLSLQIACFSPSFDRVKAAQAAQTQTVSQRVRIRLVEMGGREKGH